MNGAARWAGGGVRPDLLDILTAVVLLALLLYAAYLQFPTYAQNAASSASRERDAPATAPPVSPAP